MFDVWSSNFIQHHVASRANVWSFRGVSKTRGRGWGRGLGQRRGRGRTRGRRGSGSLIFITFLSFFFFFFFNIFILSLFSFVLYPNTDFSRFALAVHIYREGVNGVEAFVRRLIFWLFLRLTVKGEVSRKFAVISKPQNACLSAETKK